MVLLNCIHRSVFKNNRWLGFKRFLGTSCCYSRIRKGCRPKEALFWTFDPQRPRRTVCKQGFSQLLEKAWLYSKHEPKGNCWDNAVAESFFHTIKNQLIRHAKFKTKHEAELALFNYIEAYYNRRRRHSSNGWVSPVEYEYRNKQYDLVA